MPTYYHKFIQLLFITTICFSEVAFLQDIGEPRLAKIIDGGIDNITIQSNNLARVSLWIESEDCFFEEEIYSGDYPFTRDGHIVVYFIYANICPENAYKLASFELELELRDREYTIIFNDHEIKLKLTNEPYQINAVFTELLIDDVNSEYVSLIAKGTYGSICSREITNTFSDIRGTTIFVTVIVEEEPNTYCLQALSSVEHKFEIPIINLGRGGYKVQLGELEAFFEKP
jgi:hypothetical protein